MDEPSPQSKQESAQAFADGPALLRKLAKDVVRDKWFIDLCELVIAQPGKEFHEKLVHDLFLSFDGGATVGHWLRAATPSQSNQAGTSAVPAQRVAFDRLGPFDNFRKLDSSLTLKPEKNFTLVFGTNGSGKSSVCLALRCLAREDKPDTLLSNARSAANKHSFSFRLTNSGADEVWSETDGFGAFVNEIAYFDGKIANALVENPAKPEQAIEIAPFGLEVFTHAGLLLTELDRECARQLSILSSDELAKFQKLRAGCPDIALLADSNEVSEQDRWLRGLVGTKIDWDKAIDPDALDSAQRELKELQDNLAPGRAGHLKALLRSTSAARSLVFEQAYRLRKLSKINEIVIAEKRSGYEKSRNELLQLVLTSGEAEEAFLRLLQEANKVKELSADSEYCPLCKQELIGDAPSLFGEYKKLLADAVLVDIEAATKTLKQYKQGRMDIAGTLSGWDAGDLDHCLQEADVERANEVADRLRQSVSEPEGAFEPTDQYKSDVEQARLLALYLRQMKRKLNAQLDELAEDESELLAKIAKQKAVVRQLRIKKFRYEADAELSEYGDAKKKTSGLETKRNNAGWKDKRTKLTQGLRQAHETLIRSEFANALDAEYVRITDGIGMDHFGVSISIDAAQQSINLAAEIAGSHRISSVLSEGEQRLHAISLFFAEAKIRKPHVMVFDDPSTSFDYSYSDGVASRISEFADENPDTQIIVFTHNWEFYSKLDQELRAMKKRRKSGGLSFDMDTLFVQRCEEIKEHTDDVDKMRDSIEQDIRNLPASPSETQVRSACADIRAWIECIVNKYVFNSQRMGFKTRNADTLNMAEFMKVRQLDPAYAGKLGKIASKTSDWIHKQGKSSQLVLLTQAQLKYYFDEVDGVLTAMKDDRKNDAAFH